MKKIYAINKRGTTILTTALDRFDVGATIEGVWNYDEYSCTLAGEAFVIVGTEEEYTPEESFQAILDHHNSNFETYITGMVIPIDKSRMIYSRLGKEELEERKKRRSQGSDDQEGYEMTI